MISIQFTKLVNCLNELEKTTKKLEKIEILKEFLKTVDANELGSICRLITAKLFLPWEGEFLGVAEKMVIKVISKAMNVKIQAIIDQQRKTGDLGATTELFAKRKIKTGNLLEALGVQLQSLTVKKVFNSLQSIAKITGEGSVNRKQDLIVNLLAVASPIEAKFIVRIVLGDLRIGVAELSLLDALGETYLTSKEEKKLLDHKFNIHPDIGHIAYLLSKEGKKGLDKISIGTGIPIRTMAAQRLSKPEEILEKLGDSCAIEWKYDGERVQAHVDPNKIALFSRNLENITSQYPDIVESLYNQFSNRKLILEGEIVAIDQQTGKFRPFQDLMKRRRKYGIAEAMNEFPVSLYLFDILFMDSTTYIDTPYQTRRAVLENLFSQQKDERLQLADRFIIASPEEMGEKFLESIDSGSEGIIAKGLNEHYQPGLRGWGWIKLKRDYKEELVDSFDLVVIGAYMGKGRRAGMYGALLMACFDDEKENFLTVCKLGTGFSDIELQELNNKLKPLQRSNAHSKVKLPKTHIPEIYFEPKLVLEVQAAEITLSPEHTCGYGRIKEDTGLALRFPRFIRYRLEKSAEQATSQSEILSIFQQQRK